MSETEYVENLNALVVSAGSDLGASLAAYEQIVAIRSASRIGYSDLGVNRNRVQNLRSSLTARGVVR